MPKILITDSKGLYQQTGIGLDCKYVANRVAVVDANSNDTTITKCASGDHLFFGLTTGIAGALTNDDNAYTFQLPVPTAIGEKIVIQAMNATAYASLLGISSADPSTVIMRYIAKSNGVTVETGVTAAGVDGTANTMIKISATHFAIGDKITCTSLSETLWLVEIDECGGLLAGGDIAIDPGHASGYID